MSVEQAEALARNGFVGGRVPLVYNAGVYIGASLLGALQFGAAAVVLALSLQIGVDGPERALTLGAYAAAAAASGFVLTIIARRFHRGVCELEIDETGISELEDGALRAAVPWRDARAHTTHRRVRTRSVLTDYWWVTFASSRGDVIHVNNADDGVLWPRLPIRDLAHAEVDKLAAIAAELPQLDRIPPSRERRAYVGPPLVRVLNALATLAIVIVLYNVYEPVFARRHFSRDNLPLAAIVLGVLSVVRLLPAIAALRSLASPATPANVSTYRSDAIAPRAADPRYLRLERRRIVLRLLVRIATMLFLIACPLLLQAA